MPCYIDRPMADFHGSNLGRIRFSLTPEPFLILLPRSCWLSSLQDHHATPELRRGRFADSDRGSEKGDRSEPFVRAVGFLAQYFASQHKPVSCFDLAGVAWIDTAGKELRLRRVNCSTWLFGVGTSSFRRPSPTPPRPGATLPRLKRHRGCTTCFPRIRHHLAQTARSGRAEP